MVNPVTIDSIYQMSGKALVELKSWLEPWFPPQRIDSTENQGLRDGVNSVDPVTGNEDANLVLTSIGDGGSIWKAIGSSGQNLPDYLAGLLANYAYYKLEETGTANWADSSGGGRHLTWHDPASGTPSTQTRGVLGYAIEQEVGGPLAARLDGGTPGAGRTYNGIGSLTNSFFGMPNLSPFTVAFWINIHWASFASFWEVGVMGTLGGGASTGKGWGIFIDPDFSNPFFCLGDVNEPGRCVLYAQHPLVQDVPAYVMCVFTGATMKIFVDGVLANSGMFQADGTTVVSTPLDLGSSPRTALTVGGCNIYESLGTFGTLKDATLDSIIITDQDLTDYATELHDAQSAQMVWDTDLISSGDADVGDVITADGAGGTSYSPPTLEVTFT